MGLRTLDEFREDLSVALGQPGVSSRWLDRRINTGYYNVAAAIKHKTLEEFMTASTVVGKTDLALPPRLLGIRSAVDRTNERQLIRFDARNLDRETLLTNDQPRYYDWLGDRLVLVPPPDGIYTVEILVVREPVRLANAADVTVLPAIWDDPIGVMAEAEGLFRLNRRQEGTEVFERGVRLINARTPEPEWEAGSISAPAFVVRDLVDLVKVKP